MFNFYSKIMHNPDVLRHCIFFLFLTYLAILLSRVLPCPSLSVYNHSLCALCPIFRSTCFPPPVPGPCATQGWAVDFQPSCQASALQASAQWQAFPAGMLRFLMGFSTQGWGTPLSTATVGSGRLQLAAAGCALCCSPGKCIEKVLPQRGLLMPFWLLVVCDC